MRFTFLLLPLFYGLSAFAAPNLTLSTRFQYLPSGEPLTTDRALGLDPDQPNIHRQRWLLERRVQLEGLRTVELAKGRFGITADGLVLIAQSHVRPDGPWYRPISEFPCTQEPVSWFATPEGTRKAVDAAAQDWQSGISEAKGRLEILLTRVSESTPALAEEVGKNIFQNWRVTATEEWRERVFAKVRTVEWNFYRTIAANFCKERKTRARTDFVPPAWDSMLEPVPATGTPKLLARAPARRWNGLYSVRLNLRVGDKTLNGQFLLDSAARSSILSPDWLKSQGALPVEVQMTADPFERIRWGAARRAEGEGLLARHVHVEGVELSGFMVPMSEFLLFEVSFFNQPESLAGCCSGLLGTDFLKRVVAEFRPENGSEVRFYAPENFRPEGEGWVWLETATTVFGELASPCQMQGKSGATPLKPRSGVIWNIAEERPLSITSSFPPAAEWALNCAGMQLAQALPGDKSPYPENRRVAIAADVGSPVLSRGPFILDLPHGRIWFKQEAFGKNVAVNRSGLSVKYVFKDGDRALKVTGLDPKSSAQALAKAGLKAGMFITEVDGKPAEDLDEWEVLQRLSGARGDTVTLKWNVLKKSVIAPLKVR